MSSRGASAARRESALKTGNNGGGKISVVSKKDPKLSSGGLLQGVRGIRGVLASSYIYSLLVFVPIGIVTGLLGMNPSLVFVFNLLAIIPLAMLLSFATEELSFNAGQAFGAVLNATFGNAVEMIVSTVALKRGEIRIVQSSMLGAILSNILLGLGLCLFVGGYNHDCKFNATAASIMSSLMAVASASLIIPAALNMTYAQNSTEEAQSSILTLSRGASIVLLILYAIYLNFQLRTHSSFFEEEEMPVEKDRVDGLKQLKKAEVRAERILTPPAALATLFLISMTIALCAEFLVGTIDDIVQIYGVNRTFIGLIILPIVGNAAEHISAVIAASKNKMDLALGVALGSSLQIALLVTPTLVLLGWVVGQPMSLSFEPFGAGVFFLSVIVVTGLIQDGDSNYLEGAMLVGIYAIIAMAFYVYPDNVIHDENIIKYL